MGHFACNTPCMSWVKGLFLGELKGPGDSTGLEWELHLSGYFCGVTRYSSLAFFMYLLFKFIPHEQPTSLPYLLPFLPSLPFSESLSAAPVCQWSSRKLKEHKPPYCTSRSKHIFIQKTHWGCRYMNMASACQNKTQFTFFLMF